MPFRPVSRDQFEVLSPKQVRHRPLGLVFSAYPEEPAPAAPIDERTADERAVDEDGYEYNHDEVAREAQDILRDLANGAMR